jgi:hypothetical protein
VDAIGHELRDHICLRLRRFRHIRCFGGNLRTLLLVGRDISGRVILDRRLGNRFWFRIVEVEPWLPIVSSDAHRARLGC